MRTSINELGYQIKIHRIKLNLSEQKLVDKIGENQGVNISIISDIENGKLLVDTNVLKKICETVKLPNPIWEHFLNEKSRKRLEFENLLEELCGEELSTYKLDNIIISVIEEKIDNLFKAGLSLPQLYDCFNSIVVYYGILPLSYDFFKHYFDHDSLKNISNFKNVVSKVKIDAIRLYSSISEAYHTLNTSTNFNSLLIPIEPKSKEEIGKYTTRTEWNKIAKIPDEDLPNLGYIAATKVRQEKKERERLAQLLTEMADKKANKTFDINTYTYKQKRILTSLLRKFNATSTVLNGIFAGGLFDVNEDDLRTEAKHVNPKDEKDYKAIEKTQNIAYNNLANYLTADYMDVYVATSMRNLADFISVNQFVESLFQRDELQSLKLRYFNPTQSWIEDRVAKGLVEALMLRRANICIYMAQKEDTFGKDSEASVTLGQGKTVIIYVPKLSDEILKIDSEKSGHKKRGELIDAIEEISVEAKNNIDELEDNQAIHSQLIHLKLEKATDDDYIRVIKSHWADFDIYGEVDKRLKNKNKVEGEDEEHEGIYSTLKKWLKEVIENKRPKLKLSEEQKGELKGILVAITIDFEKRAKVFREVHPLALQVIRDTRVLNGILVVRSIESCAILVKSLIENKLNLVFDDSDPNNYILKEKETLSTIRVISKHRLIANAFKTYYNKNQ